ncbi:threonine synthase [bacterium BMS3Abin05]|nr:threonine synthase [bacterium BMS3Abin05]GBE28680.1 threonine synthase [bacterium BMS3Bbin03]HDZ11677.1 threonine synthase [Bacteroidota bacterium]
MEFTTHLVCRECGKKYPLEPLTVCEDCFGPLELDYDYERIRHSLTKKILKSRPQTMWRYKEFLPLKGEPRVGKDVGFTPLIHASRLGETLGLKNLYLKNDAVNFPTLSFKDRVVSVSISKAIEFGFTVVGCASTGNLANAVAAQAAASGLESYIFIPEDLEAAKIMASAVYRPHLIKVKNNYDAVNRLCSEIADEKGWAIVNVNLRPYYAEGSKTMGYEILEQLGFRVPDNVIIPMAGGSLLNKIKKSFDEFETMEWIDTHKTRFFGAQATGCAPISTAFKKNSSEIQPVKPQTIAKSLAIGNPADGHYAVQTIRNSGGRADDVSDREIVDAIKLLAVTEGIFTETAGGVTIGVLKKMVEEKEIRPDELTVACITGQGLKTIEALSERDYPIPVIEADYDQFEALLH